jgi:hypothetical protein
LSGVSWPGSPFAKSYTVDRGAEIAPIIAREKLACDKELPGKFSTKRKCKKRGDPEWASFWGTCRLKALPSPKTGGG